MRVLMLDAPTEMLAERRGLASCYGTGLFDDDASHRVPDLLFCRPERLSERGAEGADLVVEVRSPDDGSHELFRLVGRRLLSVSTAGGVVESEVLGIQLATVDGALRITWPDGSADI